MNKLYFGDNLDVLREYVPDESIDLVYLDPPFNSNANYNVLFKGAGGKSSEAQAEIVTVADMLVGRLPKMPPLPDVQTARLPTFKRREVDQLELLFTIAGQKKAAEEGEFFDPRYLSLG